MDKESVAVVAAMVSLLSGIVLCYISFFRSETGEIGNSVLWYLGQTLCFAGSVFGLKSYIDYRTSQKPPKGGG